jgi:hypothetical protein
MASEGVQDPVPAEPVVASEEAAVPAASADTAEPVVPLMEVVRRQYLQS